MTGVHEVVHTQSDSGSGIGLMVAVLLFAILMFMFLYFGLPALRNATSAPQINVPGKIDVNVNK